MNLGLAEAEPLLDIEPLIGVAWDSALLMNRSTDDIICRCCDSCEAITELSSV